MKKRVGKGDPKKKIMDKMVGIETLSEILVGK